MQQVLEKVGETIHIGYKQYFNNALAQFDHDRDLTKFKAEVKYIKNQLSAKELNNLNLGFDLNNEIQTVKNFEYLLEQTRIVGVLHNYLHVLENKLNRSEEKYNLISQLSNALLGEDNLTEDNFKTYLEKLEKKTRQIVEEYQQSFSNKKDKSNIESFLQKVTYFFGEEVNKTNVPSTLIFN